LKNTFLQAMVVKTAIAALRVCVFLPYAGQMAVGGALGRLFLHLGKRRRHIARVNLRLCFPELSETARETLLRAHFIALGRGLIEASCAWWAGQRWRARHVRSEGLEYVRAAQSQGRAVILLSAHFTPIELSLLVEIPGACLTFRPHENPLLDDIIRRQREARGKRTISRNAIRDMLRVLKQNGVLWIAPDQSYAGSNSVNADFFGVPAATTTLVASLARKSGAAVVPFFVYREEEGARQYVLKLYPPLENFPEDDESRNAARLNHAIEAQARLVPAQYFWVHRRFKHSPNGDPYLKP
jgi:Kdo2-lipid IVA lauroyltransferase/acyltransferase